MKEYIIKKIANYSEINWDLIEKSEINERGWDVGPNYVSYAQMVFIPDYGFVIKLTCNEVNPWAQYKQDGEPVYMDSCLEAFFLFDNKKYINLETNSIGTRLQGFGEDRHGRLSLLNMPFNGFKVEAKKDNDSWSVLINIPLSDLSKIYDVEFVPGYEFKGNFYKTGKNPVDGVEHYYMWNRVNTPKPDFHQSSYFGKLIIDK